MSVLIEWYETADELVFGNGASGTRYILAPGMVEGNRGWVLEICGEVVEAASGQETLCRAALQMEALAEIALLPGVETSAGRLVGAQKCLEREKEYFHAETVRRGWTDKTALHPSACRLTGHINTLNRLSQVITARIELARQNAAQHQSIVPLAA